MPDILRVVVALVVVGLLGRAARPAWRNRRLAVAVWRRIRLGHVVGCLALLAVVLATAVALMTFVPFTGYGLGSLIGLSGNAVFAPVQEATATARTPGSAAMPWVTVGAVAFLGLLLVLFPWLAYVEERVFRDGLETAGPGREAWTALRFGLLHLVMLIPLAAALAVGVTGFAYGRVYRAAYARAARQADRVPAGPPATAGERTRRARDHAVLAATVWHTTFNSLIVAILLVALVTGSL